MVDSVADVLVTIVNGLLTVVGRVLDLQTALLLLSALCLVWLFAVDMEILDRRAYKPSVRPH